MERNSALEALCLPGGLVGGMLRQLTAEHAAHCAGPRVPVSYNYVIALN
jgi:hypothetical protein